VALEQACHEVHEAVRLDRDWSDLLACAPDVILLPWTDTEVAQDTFSRLRSFEAARDVRTIVVSPGEEIHRAVAALDFGAVARIIDQEVGTSLSLNGRWFF